MAKTIKINFNNEEYTLEYTRRSIEMMEKTGFVASDLRDKPLSTFPVFFAGAFLAHHRLLKKETIDAIFAAIPNKSEFLDKLIEMYNEPIEAYMDEPGESKGNLTWGASW